MTAGARAMLNETEVWISAYGLMSLEMVLFSQPFHLSPFTRGCVSYGLNPKCPEHSGVIKGNSGKIGALQNTTF